MSRNITARELRELLDQIPDDCEIWGYEGNSARWRFVCGIVFDNGGVIHNGLDSRPESTVAEAEHKVQISGFGTVPVWAEDLKPDQ